MKILSILVDGSEPAVEPSAELFDLDGDGYLEDEDCDDANPEHFPGAEDPFGDDITIKLDDGVDGIAPVECADFEVEDCSNCSPQNGWVMVRVMMEMYEYNGQPVDFNCEDLNYDGRLYVSICRQ